MNNFKLGHKEVYYGEKQGHISKYKKQQYFLKKEKKKETALAVSAISQNKRTEK